MPDAGGDPSSGCSVKARTRKATACEGGLEPGRKRGRRAKRKEDVSLGLGSKGNTEML